MGNEQSTQLIGDDVLPETLSERSLKGIADYIKSGKATKIAVMSGAGMSTASGSKYLVNSSILWYSECQS